MLSDVTEIAFDLGIFLLYGALGALLELAGIGLISLAFRLAYALRRGP